MPEPKQVSIDADGLIIDTIPALAWSALPDGSVDFVNQRWMDYTGLSLGQGLGLGGRAAFHPEDLPRLGAEWRAALAEGEQFETEARVRRKDGEYRWFLIRAVPLRDQTGNIVKWYGTNTDIDDRKQMEEIRTAQARQAAVRADVSAALSKPANLKEILRGSAEAIVRHLDAAFARIWTLNKAQNVLELQASAGIYTHLDGPHSRVEVGKLKIGLIAQEKTPHLTNDVLNDPRVSDKLWAREEEIVSFAGYPLIVEDDLVGVMAMFARQRLSESTLDTLASIEDAIAQGIERKRAAEIIRLSEEKYRDLFDLCPDAIYVRDKDGNLVGANPAGLELLGSTAEEAIGMSTAETYLPEELALYQERLEKLNTGSRLRFERTFVRRDGAQVAVEVS